MVVVVKGIGNGQQLMDRTKALASGGSSSDDGDGGGDDI